MTPWSFRGGLPETACGYGSTLKGSAQLREVLPLFLRSFQVKRLIDAPCGDFHWMSQVDLSGIDYLGLDEDMSAIGKAFGKISPPRFAPKSRVFKRWDIVHYPPPVDADAVLCRDFMQHLPYADVFVVLRHFINMDISWIMLTSHAVKTNGHDLAERGLYRPVNFRLLPFELPEPAEFLPDGPDRFLGVWSREAIRESRLFVART